MELVRAAFDAMNADDVERGLATAHEEIEFLPLASKQVDGRGYRGHAGLREWDRERRDTWDLAYQIDEMTPIGSDRLLAYGRIRSRGKGSGVELDVEHSWLFDFRDDKIVRAEAFTDPAEARAAAERRTR
jgi:ketosteroid isomerase-like protein